MFSDLDWLGLITWFTLTFGMGNVISGSMTTGRFANVFRDSRYFTIQPPSVVFSAIWIIIYTLNAVGEPAACSIHGTAQP